MIQIHCFTFNAFQQNTYLLWDESKEAVLIDAGCYDTDEKDELREFIQKNELKLRYLLLTHSHIDHVLGAAFVEQTYNVPIVSHKKDQATFLMNQIVASNWGFPNYESTKATVFVDEGDKISFGNSELEILFTPGHSEGHIVFLNKIQNFCINGDVLFRGSVGRTDLPNGSWEVLENSIREKMYKLDDTMQVFCGHGQATTIGYEKRNNPFVRA